MSKKVFISYSHEDKPVVTRLAKLLNDQGVDLWFDEWDIRPGDSLVQKIFTEGLGGSDLFLVVLSGHSVQSKWVREELDVATVQRISGVIRIVPLVIEDCELPMSLRSLVWVDVSRDFEEGVRKVVNLVYDMTERPPLGSAPPRVLQARATVPGLTPLASMVGTFILENTDSDRDVSRMFTGDQMKEALDLSATEINDAVDELVDMGFAETLRTLGTAPYNFRQAGPTYTLYLALQDRLPYDPEADIRIVAATVASLKRVNASDLARRTDLSPGRLNRAAEYLKDNGLMETIEAFGSAPYAFRIAEATRHTRRFAEDGQ
jgi:hypothetical protein